MEKTLNKGEPSRTKKNPTRITAEPAKQEIIITRDFDAPRELVFKAFTDPSLYVQWIGLRGLTTTLETFEPTKRGQVAIYSDGSGWQRVRFSRGEPSGVTAREDHWHF